MKKFLQKNRIFTVLFLVLFFSIFKSPVYGQEKTEEFVFTHTHERSCYMTSVTNCEADGTPYGEITNSETCKLCGAELHHYRIQTKCSCGASFDDRGFACMNSPYGSNVGECTNYEAVENTMHEHEEKVQICILEENEVVAKVAVYRSTTGMTRENVRLRLALEKGNGSAFFQENGSSELTVSQNGNVNIRISYDERFVSKISNQTISVKNIDCAAPKISFNITPVNWTEGECTVSVQASDSADGGNAVSGIAASGYSFDGGKTWGTVSTKHYQDTVQSEIWVKDNAGNITKQAFFAEKKEPPTEKEEEPNEKEEQPTEVAELPSEKRELPTEQEERPVEKTESAEEEQRTPVNELREIGTLGQAVYSTEEKSEETHLFQENDIMLSEKTSTAGMSLSEEDIQTGVTVQGSFSFASMYRRIVQWVKKPAVVVSFSVASISGGVLLLAGYYFLIGMGTVACVDVTGTERFVAKIIVRRKKGKWRIVIGEELAMRCGTRNLVLYVPSWFAKLFAYQTILIDMPNGIQEFYVEKRLAFLLLE